MKENEEYKEYPLEFTGDPFLGVQYFITVNSNNKKLKFNIDSGAEANLVSSVALDGCSYNDTGANMEFRSVLNSANVNIIFLEFIIDDVDFNSVNPEDRYKLFFSVMPAEQDSVFDDYDYDGLLGATFLQFCEVNFREGFIRVYKDHFSGKVTSTLLADLEEKYKAYREQEGLDGQEVKL